MKKTAIYLRLAHRGALAQRLLLALGSETNVLNLWSVSGRSGHGRDEGSRRSALDDPVQTSGVQCNRLLGCRMTRVPAD
jgi:hypothetical protein